MYRQSFTLFVLCLISFALQTKAQSFVNGSFENWGLPNSCEINGSPDGWINYSTGCVAFDEANQLLCTSTIPGSASNGNIYARACAGPDWQGGEGVYQMVNNLNIGQQYTFSFDYAGSNLYGGTDSCTWRVFIDDILVSQTPYFSSLQSIWINYPVSFTATQTTHKIGVRAYFINPCSTCAGSAGLDNIKFLELPTSTVHQQYEGIINIYPVPIGNYLTITNANQEAVDMELYDVHAKVVLRTNFIGSVDINTTTLPSGVYVAVIRKKGRAMYKKMIAKE